MSEAFRWMVLVYSIFLFIYAVGVDLLFMGLILISWRKLRDFSRKVNTDITLTTPYTKPISILVPAYNEATTILDNIQSLLNLNYPEYEVVVINDGSSDGTLEKVIHHFQLNKAQVTSNNRLNTKEVKAIYLSEKYPNLIVADKLNGGKADALNAGINLSRYPLFCSIDADCMIEPDALLRIAAPFAKYKETVAVGGMVRIVNGSRLEKGKVMEAAVPAKFIEKFQVVEYFRAFLTSRSGWDRMNALPIISGAFGLFRKASVLEVGGYKETIGEDMELVLSMHEHYRREKIPYKIDFASDAVCWTQAPDSARGLKVQRIRWHRGLKDSLYRHKKMLLNPSYGYLGMLSLPYFWLVELLGPVIEFGGYLIAVFSLIFRDLTAMILLIFLASWILGILFSYSAIFFEEAVYYRYKSTKDMMKLFEASIVEQFLFRPMTVWWRVISFFPARKGSRAWGTIERREFSSAEEAERENRDSL